MSSSIRLSEKHGANPAITKCFYCGKEIGVALLGKIKTKDQYGNIDPDGKAPMYIIADYEPCDECKARLEGSFRIYGIAPKSKYPHMPEIIKGYIVTKFIAISADEAENFLNHFQDMPDDTKKAALEKSGILLEENVFEQVIQIPEDE